MRGARCGAPGAQARAALLRPEAGENDARKTKSDIKACRKFEKGALGSKKAAAEAKGWTLLRFDLSDPRHAAFALKLGVRKAPALLVFERDKEAPTDLGTKLRGANLAYYLKKLSAPAVNDAEEK